jgi:hypothetical protein
VDNRRLDSAGIVAAIVPAQNQSFGTILLPFARDWRPMGSILHCFGVLALALRLKSGH